MGLRHWFLPKRKKLAAKSERIAAARLSSAPASASSLIRIAEETVTEGVIVEVEPERPSAETAEVEAEAAAAAETAPPGPDAPPAGADAEPELAPSMEPEAAPGDAPEPALAPAPSPAPESAPAPAPYQTSIHPGAVGADDLTAGAARLRGSLSPEQRTMLDAAKEVFLAAGGKLDAYGDAFVLRFLKFNGWSEAKTHKHLCSTAKWRMASFSGKGERSPADVRAWYLSGSVPVDRYEVRVHGQFASVQQRARRLLCALMRHHHHHHHHFTDTDTDTDTALWEVLL